MSDMISRLRNAKMWFNNQECCGQKDSEGICSAPACIYGEAMAEFQKCANEIEKLTDAVASIQKRSLMFMREREEARADLAAEQTARREAIEDRDAIAEHRDVLHAELAAERERDSDNYYAAEARVAKARVTKLRESLMDFVSYGCPACGGDCASANPPVALCPMQNARAALSETGGENGSN